MRIRPRFLGCVHPVPRPPLLAQQPAAAPAPAKPDHVTANQAIARASMATLHQYEWIETTAVSMKGEEKSRTQAQCYYGADGKVQKVPIGAPPADDKSVGLRGSRREQKEDISDSVKECESRWFKQYVPPDPLRIDAARRQEGSP